MNIAENFYKIINYVSIFFHNMVEIFEFRVIVQMYQFE